MKFEAFLLVMFFIAPTVFASQSDETYIISMGGTGSNIIHTEQYGIISDSKNGFITGGNHWYEHSAGSHVVTGQGGYSFVEYKENYNASQSNQYKGNLRLSTDQPAVVGNQYYMRENVPNVPEISCEAAGLVAGLAATTGTNPSHQKVEIHKTGMFGYGDYESNAVIDDANVTSDTSHEFGGGGLYLEDISSQKEVGFNKDDSSLGFSSYKRTHFGRINDPDATNTSTFISDYKYRDFKGVFGVDNQTSNSSFVMNTTG